MSKDKTKPDADSADSADSAKPKSRKRKFIVIGVLLLMLSGSAAAWWTLRGAHDDKEVKAEPAKKTPPVFVNLDNFTVNLAGLDHYLQLGVTFEVNGPEGTEAIKQVMPILRSRILLLLASKNSQDLVSTEGKSRLAEELVEQARTIVTLPAPDKSITAVHFSSFVIQ